MRLNMLALTLCLGSVLSAAGASSHKVRKGELAGRIARHYHLSLTRLQALNPNQNLARLSVGTVLKVAGEPTSVRASAARQVKRVNTNFTPALPPLPELPKSTLAALTHIESVVPTILPEGSSIASATPVFVLPPLTSATPVETPAPSIVDPDNLDLLWPVETRTISSAWGPRVRSKVVRVKSVKNNKKRRVRVRYQSTHKGVDLTASEGTDIYASLDGVVITATRHRQYGNYVVIDHGNGVVTVYAHARKLFAQEGDRVKRGQKIAEVGHTGRSTGPHLHFELRVDGTHRNPLPCLNDAEEISLEMATYNDGILPPERTKNRR